LIKKAGEAEEEFYSEIVKWVPYQRITWYAHAAQGESFHKFADFELTEVPTGLRFCICCYEQNRLEGESLERYRKTLQNAVRELTMVFKRYCEEQAFDPQDNHPRR